MRSHAQTAQRLIAMIGVVLFAVSCTSDADDQALDIEDAAEVAAVQDADAEETGDDSAESTTTVAAEPVVVPDGWAEYVSPAGYSVLLPAGPAESRDVFPGNDSIARVSAGAQSGDVIYTVTHLEGIDSDESDFESYFEGVEDSLQAEDGGPPERSTDDDIVLNDTLCRRVTWDGLGLVQGLDLSSGLAIACVNPSGLLISLFTMGPADLADRPTTEAFINSFTVIDQ